MKATITLLLLLAFVPGTKGQSITNATISCSGGVFRNGNITLNFSIGEPGTSSSDTTTAIKLSSGLWQVVTISYVSASAIIYRFTGNGNFTDPANWENGRVPLNPLPAGAEVIISPVAGGQCILNTSFTVSPNARFSIVNGSKFIIPGNLDIHKP